MPRRDVVWKALLVLATLVVRSHAQSPFESSSWVPKPGAILQTGHSFARGGTPQIDSDPDALSADHRSGEAKSDSAAVVRPKNQPELDRGVYYRNKLEFAFDAGWLPINIPFVFDIFMGDAYTRAPLDYTLVPLVASLRWHIDDVGGPWIFRGNWDMTFSGSVTLIPRGPETHYFSYDMGIRRNFVPRRGKIAPYFDGRLGLGRIDAKEPLGVQFAQGQNFTFTMNMGAGARYNFNPRYSLSAGLNWMHISNLYLSEPAFSNYGINVYGPLFGIDIRLGKPRHASQ
jgi:Lipid A 3-O-deacylase (PagL)